MSALWTRAVTAIAGSRKSWPSWLSRLFDATVALVPERLALKLNPGRYGFVAGDVPPPPGPPSTDIRLYIAPVNYAGQGYRWARAAERLPGVGSCNMHYTRDGGYGFPADYSVPVTVFRNSRRWQHDQFEAVATGFTHVIFEAGRSIFGARFDLSPLREAEELRKRGVRVAMLSHGSDLRLPSRHREIDEWSPFHEPEWEMIPRLEEQAQKHRELLSRVGAPVFVSTPDLLLDWPTAHWIPVVIDPKTWETHEPPLLRDRPIVVHAPTNPIIKGSEHIAPAMQRLHDRGLIDFRRIEGVPAAEMPALYRGADIVLDQFRIGNYGTASIEALAAGRVVIAHVHEQVRDHVRAGYGKEIPIVQATIASLEAVILDILERRDHYRAVAASGPDFVRGLHDGTAAAEVLRDFLAT